jgi:hypothetical protein
MTSLFISEEAAELLPVPIVEQDEFVNRNTRYSFPNIETNNAFIPGKFEYTNERDRLMFSNAWRAITLTENWDFVKADIESFTWSDDPIIDIISAKMDELGYNGHSGASFGYTMRTMQYIARNGEEKFKEDYLKNRTL